MRLVVALALTGCSFQPGMLGGAPVDDSGVIDTTDAAPDDASTDAAIDAMPDATPDAPPAVAQTTNHGSVADTFLGGNSYATTNFNGQASSLVDGAPDPCVLVMRFDLTSIATTALVTGAQLYIWSDNDSGNTVSLYPLLEGFQETTATWNQRSTGTNWLAAGAAPPSRGTTAIGTVNPTSTFTGYVITIDTATVAGWVANPAANHGIAFVTTDADGTRFSNREHPTTTVRPYLAVTHAP